MTNEKQEFKFCKILSVKWSTKTNENGFGFIGEYTEQPCIFHEFFIETKGFHRNCECPSQTIAKAIISIDGEVEIIDADELIFIDEQEYKNLKNAKVQTGGNMARN